MLKLLNWQGIAGIGVGLALLIMLTVQKLEAVHWQKQSEKFEQLYQEEQAAFATTVASARAAADQARAEDKANAARVAAAQQTINQRTADDYEARISAARARADQLRLHSQAAAHPGARGNAPVPELPAPAGGAAQAASQDRLPAPDALTATEQAIQLDELIKWVRSQHSVGPNALPRPTGSQAAVDNTLKAVASPPRD
jgi:hypothetical protein